MQPSLVGPTCKGLEFLCKAPETQEYENGYILRIHRVWINLEQKGDPRGKVCLRHMKDRRNVEILDQI